MHMTRRMVLWISVAAIFFIAGCASTTGTSTSFYAESAHWQGRLAVQVSSTPPQAFSADFALSGSPQQGELTFSSALGTTLARMHWDASGATLWARGETQQFDSLKQLATSVVGTDLPITAVFAWLQGQNAVVDGWQADLSALAEGRMSAHRSTPQPTAQLKIILER